MAAVNNNGDMQYWMDGDVYQGIRDPNSWTGDMRYSIDGTVEEDQFPQQNSDTGDFFLIFE